MSVLPVGFGSAAGGGGFQIERSLRFNSADSAYLNRTPASAGNRKTWTWSGWVKRGKLGSRNIFFAAGVAGNNFGLEFSANNELDTYQYVAGYQWQLISSSVYRDVSAWYHIVLALDTTQATSTNRVKLYVNGVQVTAFSTSTYPTQNTDYLVNSTNQHNISNVSGASLYMDGYMTEVNFIDGQALTPSSFGETDANTGVWKPKAFSGTYGTNGFYLPFKTASQWSGYFDGNADHLSVPHNSSLSPTGDFTIEFWAYTGSTAVQEWVTKGLGIQIYSYLSNWYVALSSSNNATYFINGSFGVHSTNTWQHIAISRQGNTYRGFVNGVATTLGTSSSAPSTGTDSLFVGAIGVGGTPYYATGYLSNLRIVNGTAVYTGTFTPPTSQLTAITNTSLLTCQSSTFVDNSTNAFTVTANGDALTQQFSPFTLDVTDDHSGQGNHWQPNNLDLRTTGVGADILVDSPTSYGTDTGVGGSVRGNYATWNPLATSPAAPVTFSNGNLNVSFGSSLTGRTQSTIGVSSGKWYAEVTVTAASGTDRIIGIVTPTTNNEPGYTADSYGYYGNGQKINNNTLTNYGASYTTNDIIGIALDLDAGTITFYKNNTSQGQAFSGLSGTYLISVSDSSNAATCSYTANFGQRAFAYTAPSGFKALCTQNLPTPTIGATSTTQANDYMNVVLYSGNSSTQNITGVGFAPDFTWLKVRNDAQNHRLFDTVRGANKRIMSSSTAAEATTTDELTAFGSDGFTLGANTDVNGTGFTYVAWNWNAGGSTVTNTSGTISAQVRANTTSGFSIVTYTGNGSSSQTVGHGLGVAPAFGILKDRDTNSNNNQWQIFHTGAGDKYGYFTTAAFAGTAEFYPTSGSSTTVTIGRGSPAATTNESGDRYVMYLFAPVAGYSAFGSYTGTGNTDGPFVYTGFRPRFVLTKQSSSTSNWSIHDTSRAPYNLTINNLYPDVSDAEYTGTNESFDFLSNGFKPRAAGTPTNASGGTYIYMAFAESPFKYALAR